MVIYGEYLFLENFITGMGIAFVTGNLCREKIKPFRILLVGAMCGAYSFTIFLNISGILSFTLSFIFSFLAVIASFGYKGRKILIRQALIFVSITLLWGGISMAILFGILKESSFTGSITYMNIFTYIRVFSGVASGYLVLWLIISLVKTERQKARIEGIATIRIGERTYTFKAIIDSGNMLKDPISKREVSIISRRALEIIKEMERELEVRQVLIPFNTVAKNEETRLMEGFRVDYIEFLGSRFEKPIIGGTGKDFQGDYDLLLNGGMLERGLNEG